MDLNDKKILTELQINADRRIREFEKSTKLPRSTIHNRIQKLKKNKTIGKIKAVVDPEKIGLNVCVLIHVVISFKQGVHKVAEKLSKHKNVEEVYITAGVFDIIAKVRFKSNKELSEFIFNDTKGLKSWEGVERTESMICLETVKEHGVLES